MIPKRIKKNVNLLYMDTDSLTPLIKIEDFFKYISEDVKKWFDT